MFLRRNILAASRFFAQNRIPRETSISRCLASSHTPVSLLLATMVRPPRTVKGAVRLLATALVLACASTIFVCHMRGWDSGIVLANQLRTSFAEGEPPMEHPFAHVVEAAKTQEEQDIPSATTKKSMPEPPEVPEVPQDPNPACMKGFCTTYEDCCVGFDCWSVNEVESNNGQCVTDAQSQRMYRDYMGVPAM
jgi:hypothetical protein